MVSGKASCDQGRGGGGGGGGLAHGACTHAGAGWGGGGHVLLSWQGDASVHFCFLGGGGVKWSGVGPTLGSNRACPMAFLAFSAPHVSAAPVHCSIRLVWTPARPPC